jgi:hypothetical protein
MRKVLCPFCDSEIGEIGKTYSSVTINLSINHIEGDLFECSKCEKQFEASLQFNLVDNVEVSLGGDNATSS